MVKWPDVGSGSGGLGWAVACLQRRPYMKVAYDVFAGRAPLRDLESLAVGALPFLLPFSSFHSPLPHMKRVPCSLHGFLLEKACTRQVEERMEDGA